MSVPIGMRLSNTSEEMRPPSLTDSTTTIIEGKSNAHTVDYGGIGQSDTFWLGKLLEHPEIMTQGETLEELEENLKDAYLLMAMG